MNGEGVPKDALKRGPAAEHDLAQFTSLPLDLAHHLSAADLRLDGAASAIAQVIFGSIPPDIGLAGAVRAIGRARQDIAVALGEIALVGAR